MSARLRSHCGSQDHALIAAATGVGSQVLQASDVTVVTSARRQARAPRGFSHALRALTAEPGHGAHAAARIGSS